jgi:hypothetical protein
LDVVYGLNLGLGRLRGEPHQKESQLDSLNLESSELLTAAVIAIVLFGGLGLLRVTLKLATRVLMLGCLGIVIILAVVLAIGMTS